MATSIVVAAALATSIVAATALATITPMNVIIDETDSKDIFDVMKRRDRDWVTKAQI